MEIGHHHNTQIIWPKYDTVCNNLQAKKNVKVNLVVLQVSTTHIKNGCKFSMMLQYMYITLHVGRSLQQ